MLKKFFILIVVFSFCSSSDYQTNFENQVVKAHQNFYALPNSNDPADVSSITVKVKTECKDIRNQIKIANNKNLGLENVIDDHYISFRQAFKSDYEDSSGSREILEKKTRRNNGVFQYIV